MAKKPKAESSKTLKVDAADHAAFKAWCEARGLKIQWAASEALREYAKARPGGAL